MIRALGHLGLTLAIMLATLALIYFTFLPACRSEDSSNCIWDAQTQGNGQGRSFVDIAGHLIYLP